jgi:hypothetical protein
MSILSIDAFIIGDSVDYYHPVNFTLSEKPHYGENSIYLCVQENSFSYDIGDYGMKAAYQKEIMNLEVGTPIILYIKKSEYLPLFDKFSACLNHQTIYGLEHGGFILLDLEKQLDYKYKDKTSVFALVFVYPIIFIMCLYGWYGSLFSVLHWCSRGKSSQLLQNKWYFFGSVFLIKPEKLS